MATLPWSPPPLPSEVCAHHSLYIMYLFSGLRGDYVVLFSIRKLICMWSYLSTSVTCFSCCYIIIHLKFKLLQGEFPPTFIPLFVVSFCFFGLQRKWKNCKLWHYLYCTWSFSYIFIAYQRVLHLIRGYKVFEKKKTCSEVLMWE